MTEIATFDFPCPHCGAILEAEASDLGIEATCGSCRGEITVDRQWPPSPPRPDRLSPLSLVVKGVRVAGWVLISVLRLIGEIGSDFLWFLDRLANPRRPSNRAIQSPQKPKRSNQTASKLSSADRPSHLSSVSPPSSIRDERVSLSLMEALEWKSFEKLVEQYFIRTEVQPKLTRVGPDGGVDLELFGKKTGKLKAIVQCKAWKAYRVGVKPVRELYGVMASRGVTDGYFFTTGEFTGEARSFANNTGLRLVTGREFLNRIEALPKTEQHLIHRNITRDDYRTPTCPSCDIKMVRRVVKRGKNQGQTFWGCPCYPKCHQTFRE